MYFSNLYSHGSYDRYIHVHVVKCIQIHMCEPALFNCSTIFKSSFFGVMLHMPIGLLYLFPSFPKWFSLQHCHSWNVLWFFSTRHVWFFLACLWFLSWPTGTSATRSWTFTSTEWINTLPFVQLNSIWSNVGIWYSALLKSDKPSVIDGIMHSGTHRWMVDVCVFDTSNTLASNITKY